ncbi:MarR family winged helix-turn-helix transcriptional regulator [Rothia uropygialis]|uniref:MarR family winged helix-turn-helix transcriptional regulator n=1 Tax=Kocuria sp. 36 TaxID=1415402 RepID=UPI00237A3E60|nr:MarR family transcriptional regulator [Kocuria sp. 36]
MSNSKSPLALDNQLCFSLYRASHAMVRAYRPLLDELGLTYPQYLVMLALWQSNDSQSNDSQSVGQIGQLLGLDSGTLTPVLRRLEQRGLVVRRRDPHDERRRLIVLTDRGQELQRPAEDVPEKVWAKFPLEPEGYSSFKSQLNGVAEAFEAGRS